MEYISRRTVHPGPFSAMSYSKKSTRRKTLSHIEIDEFLRESDNVMREREVPDKAFKKTKVEDDGSLADYDVSQVPNVVAELPPEVDPDEEHEHLVRQFKALVDPC